MHRAMRRQLRMALPGTVDDRVDYVANMMDEAVTVPVIDYKIGLDPVISLVPFSGNVVALLIHFYLIFEGVIAEVPWYILTVMAGLAVTDFLFGVVTDAVPVLGTAVGFVVDAVFKANKWNGKLIKKYSSA